MRTGPAVRVFPTPRDLAEEAARSVRGVAAQAVAQGNRFGLALSGGRTPQDLYALLAEAGARALPCFSLAPKEHWVFFLKSN